MRFRTAILGGLLITAITALPSRPAAADVWVRVNAWSTWRARPANWRDYHDWGPFADWKITFRVPSWVNKRRESVWQTWRPVWYNDRAHNVFDRAYNSGGYDNNSFRSLGGGWDEMTFTVGHNARWNKYLFWENEAYARQHVIEYRAPDNWARVAIAAGLVTRAAEPPKNLFMALPQQGTNVGLFFALAQAASWDTVSPADALVQTTTLVNTVNSPIPTLGVQNEVSYPHVENPLVMD
jgi:hypothetical protein